MQTLYDVAVVERELTEAARKRMKDEDNRPQSMTVFI